MYVTVRSWAVGVACARRQQQQRRDQPSSHLAAARHLSVHGRSANRPSQPKNRARMRPQGPHRQDHDCVEGRQSKPEEAQGRAEPRPQSEPNDEAPGGACGPNAARREYRPRMQMRRITAHANALLRTVFVRLEDQAQQNLCTRVAGMSWWCGRQLGGNPRVRPGALGTHAARVMRVKARSAPLTFCWLLASNATR